MAHTFVGLRGEMAVGRATELFSRSWSLWGSVTRAIAADPHGNIEELRAAQAVFDFLGQQGAELTAKQCKQTDVCRASISALLVGCEPAAAKKAKAGKSDKAGTSAKDDRVNQEGSRKATPYAGFRQAPGADTLPAPSLLLGKTSPPAAPVQTRACPNLSF